MLAVLKKLLGELFENRNEGSFFQGEIACFLGPWGTHYFKWIFTNFRVMWIWAANLLLFSLVLVTRYPFILGIQWFKVPGILCRKGLLYRKWLLKLYVFDFCPLCLLTDSKLKFRFAQMNKCLKDRTSTPFSLSLGSGNFFYSISPFDAFRILIVFYLAHSVVLKQKECYQ